MIWSKESKTVCAWKQLAIDSHDPMRQLVLVRCNRNGEAHETKKRSQNSGTADLHGRNVIITALLDYKALTRGCTDHCVYLFIIYASKRAVKRLCVCVIYASSYSCRFRSAFQLQLACTVTVSPILLPLFSQERNIFPHVSVILTNDLDPDEPAYQNI